MPERQRERQWVVGEQHMVCQAHCYPSLLFFSLLSLFCLNLSLFRCLLSCQKLTAQISWRTDNIFLCLLHFCLCYNLGEKKSVTRPGITSLTLLTSSFSSSRGHVFLVWLSRVTSRPAYPHTQQASQPTPISREHSRTEQSKLLPLCCLRTKVGETRVLGFRRWVSESETVDLVKGRG